MIPGKKVNLGGEEYIVPPLSLGQLRNGVAEKMELHDRLVHESTNMNVDDADAIKKRREAQFLRGEIIAEALRRNYPDLTNDHLFDILDLGNWPNVWNLILGGSGFLGEGQVAEPAAQPGTSDPSTAES